MSKESLSQYSLRTLLIGTMALGSAIGIYFYRAQSLRLEAEATANKRRAACVATLVEQLIEKCEREVREVRADKQRASLALTSGRRAVITCLFLMRNSRGIRDVSDPDCDELKVQLSEIISQEGNAHQFVDSLKETISDWDSFFKIQYPDFPHKLNRQMDELQMEPERILRDRIKDLDKQIAEIERIVKNNAPRLIQFREMSNCVE